ncbi:MAG: hypothetical protein GQ522_00205 [Deltaproteobacteria bacterium]|nr:hypothetical protein [Deltaproteobacteria bacterium]
MMKLLQLDTGLPRLVREGPIPVVVRERQTVGSLMATSPDVEGRTFFRRVILKGGEGR